MYLLHKVITHPCMSKCRCTKWAYIDTYVYALLHRIRKHRYMHIFRVLWVHMITGVVYPSPRTPVDFEGDKAGAISDWKWYAVPHCATFRWQDILTEGGGRVGSSKGHLTPCFVCGSSYQSSGAAGCPLFIKQWNQCQRQKLFNRIYLAEMWHKMNFRHLTDIILNCISHLKKNLTSTLADCWNCCASFRSFVQYTGEPLWLSASDDGGRPLRLTGNDPGLLLHQHHPHLPHRRSDHRWDSQLQGSQLPTDAYQHLKSPKPREFTFLRTLKNRRTASIPLEMWHFLV